MELFAYTTSLILLILSILFVWKGNSKILVVPWSISGVISLMNLFKFGKILLEKC